MFGEFEMIDDEEEYEDSGKGNRFLGFMFGNVDNSGDLDVDYLDEVILCSLYCYFWFGDVFCFTPFLRLYFADILQFRRVCFVRRMASFFVLFLFGRVFSGEVWCFLTPGSVFTAAKFMWKIFIWSNAREINLIMIAWQKTNADISVLRKVLKTRQHDQNPHLKSESSSEPCPYSLQESRQTVHDAGDKFLTYKMLQKTFHQTNHNENQQFKSNHKLTIDQKLEY